MSRHFFATLALSNLACANRYCLYDVKMNPTGPSSNQPLAPDFHSFDNMRSLRYKFGTNIRLTFFRIRKEEKNESQKLGLSRPDAYYLRRLFSPLMR
jgi:hypothetical protein